MPKRYPTLTPREVMDILQARGFRLHRTVGSHAQYVCLLRDQNRRVTVDLHISQFDDYLLKLMIQQSALTREEFYGSTKDAAKKINLRADAFPIPLKK